MGKLADAGPPAPSRTGTRCAVAVVMETLDDDDTAALLGWLRDDDIEGSAIARHLRDHGVELSQGSLQRHRRRMCRCHVFDPQWAV